MLCEPTVDWDILELFRRLADFLDESYDTHQQAKAIKRQQHTRNVLLLAAAEREHEKRPMY